jgi:hypothetical protein
MPFGAIQFPFALIPRYLGTGYALRAYRRAGAASIAQAGLGNLKRKRQKSSLSPGTRIT